MGIPVQVTFRGMEASPAIEDAVRECAGKLDRYHAHLTGCRVVIEAPHRHHHQGKLYHVRVDLTVSGEQLVVDRAPTEHHAHEDVYVTLRDAFDAARRRLEDHVHRERGETKTHEPRRAP